MSLVLRTLFAVWASIAALTSAVSHDPPNRFSRRALAKFDAKLHEQLDRGADMVEVAVTFRGDLPSDLVLDALGLMRVGDMAIGRISLDQLAYLAARDDVRWVEGMGSVTHIGPVLPGDDGVPLPNVLPDDGARPPIVTPEGAVLEPIHELR